MRRTQARSAFGGRTLAKNVFADRRMILRSAAAVLLPNIHCDIAQAIY